MFGNFLYFIIVLLIYLTYQPSEETNFSGLESFSLFIGLIVVFFYFTLFLFRRIEKRIAVGDFKRLDHHFQAVLTRQSIMAVLLFAVDIYGLNLSSFLTDIPIFNTIPLIFPSSIRSPPLKHCYFWGSSSFISQLSGHAPTALIRSCTEVTFPDDPMLYQT